MLSGPISGSDLFCLRPSERFWINLQARYDLEVEKDRLGGRLRRGVKVLASAGA